MQTVRIFYRNRVGKDAKVLAWTTALAFPVVYRGLPMDNPANAFVMHVDSEMEDGSLVYQAVNARGVFLKKILEETLVDRDAADIAKDINNKAGLYQDCEIGIAMYMGTREKVTWVSIAVKHAFLFLKSLQEAAGIADNQLSAQGQQSLATLNWLNTAINGPVEALMVARDVQIATLDVED